MIDLHSHTTASDGQHPPAELVALARAAGVTRLAVTDHDTTAGLPEAQQAAAELGGIEVIPGIELSAFLDRQPLHLLGHFIRPEEPALARLVARQGNERRHRMEGMVEKMNGLGYPVRMAHVEAQAGSENLCRPHLARALLELGYVRHVQEAFERFIGDGGPAWVPYQRLEAADAIALVQGAGGVASLAHPGASKIDRYQIGKLKEAGLDGLEIFHPDHNPSVREKYLKIARALDLVPTAGSDFHGDQVAPDNHLGSQSLSPELFERLRARAGTQSGPGR